MGRKSQMHKRYHIQRLVDDVLVLDLNDIIDDQLFDESPSTSVVIGRLEPGHSPRDLSTNGPICIPRHQLTKDQIIYLKNSFKDYPHLIDEMGI